MREGEIVKNFDLNEKLEVNQLVELEVAGGRFEGQYSTQVVDIKNEERFIINAPFSKGQPVNLPVNGRAEIKLREEGGVYVMPVKVVARSFDSTPLLIVELRDAVTRIQEREFFRLELEEETEYRKIAETEQQFEEIIKKVNTELGQEEITFKAEEEVSEFNKTGIIKDISAGGVKLSVKEQLKEGEILEINFRFIDTSFNTLFGKVVRANEVVREEIRKYEAGINYVNANSKYQEELTRWLFVKQRELRQKGLI